VAIGRVRMHILNWFHFSNKQKFHITEGAFVTSLRGLLPQAPFDVTAALECMCQAAPFLWGVGKRQPFRAALNNPGAFPKQLIILQQPFFFLV
jgi:hypothetical protein